MRELAHIAVDLEAIGERLGVGLVVLAVTSRPLRAWKLALVGGMALSYATIFAIGPLRDYFLLDFFASWLWVVIASSVAVAGAVCVAVPFVMPGLGWSRAGAVPSPVPTR